MRKQMYTVQEVAQLLRFSDQSIREWVRDGKVRASRPGGRSYRIPLAEVQRLLQQSEIDERILDMIEPRTSLAFEAA